MIKAADLPGPKANTATATGDAPGTIPDPSDPDTFNTPLAPTPVASLELTKSASTADMNGNTITGDPGDTITYTFSVKNTGTVALTNVTVSDPLLMGMVCTPIATLAPGATGPVNCAGNTFVIKAADLPGPKVNTATATGTPPGTMTPPTDDHMVSTPLAPAPTASIVLTKSGSTVDTNGNTTVGDPGDTITYTFSVQNTGTVTLTSVTVSDPLLTGMVCSPIATLAPGATGSITCAGNTYVIKAADLPGPKANTATATGDAPGTIPDPTDPDTFNTPLAPTPIASLELTKAASTADTNTNATTGDPGDTITYTFSVHNTGTVALTNVTVTDPLLPTLSCVIASLAAGATASCTPTNNTYVIKVADLPGPKVNTASVTGTPPGTMTKPTDDHMVSTPLAPTPIASLELTKAAAIADTNTNVTLGDPGDTITYTFSVHNTGTVTLTNVTVTDPLLPTLSCVIASLAAGATASCTPTNNTYVIKAADLPGPKANTATATGTPPGTLTPPTDDHTVSTPLAPTPVASLELTKSAATADTNGNATTGDPGDTITYTFSVHNTGTVALTSVTVTDPLLPTLSCVIASLAAGATASCTPTNNTYVIKAADLPGPKANTATATGTPPGTMTPPTDDHTVNTPLAPTPVASLVLTKTGSTADTNGNTIVGDPGDTITYGFSVNNTGNVTLAPVTVTDPKLPTLSCVIAALAAGATASCTPTNNTYVIQAADVPGGVSNTATALGDAPGNIPDPSDPDTLLTPTKPAPVASIVLTKSASIADTDGNTVTGDAGDTITYTFSVQNTGTVALANVTVSDPLLTGMVCTPIASLAPAASAPISCAGNTHVITVGQQLDGKVTNTATATGDAPGTIPDPSDPDTVNTPTLPAPVASLVLTKTSTTADTNGNTVTGDSGDTITYSFSVQNTGTVTLAPVTVTDPKLPTLSCVIASLAAGATSSCTATNNTHVITAGEQTDGKVTNTASATGDAPGTIPDPTDTDKLDTPTLPKPVASLELTKTGVVADTNTNATLGDPGDTITYTFSVHNTGTVALTNVTVTDPLLPTLSCVIASLAAGATGSCTPTNNTYVIKAADLPGPKANTATVTGTPPGTLTPPTDDHTVSTPLAPAPVASLELTKSAAKADTNGNTIVGDPGDTITYTFSVHNTGTVALTNVTVTDPLLPTLSCVIASLAAGATASCTPTNNTYVILPGDLPGPKANTATATGTPPGTMTPPTDDHTISTPLAPAPVASLVLTKTGSIADTNGNTIVGDPGDTITYGFSVHNTGTVTLAPVTVTDPKLPTLSCVLASLAAGATASCTPTNNTYVVQPGDVPAGVTNTATALGDAPGTIPDPSDPDTLLTPTKPAPVASLVLTKTGVTADTNGNTVTGDSGDTITYSFSVHNTGTVTLAPVTVTDPKLPTLSCVIASLAPSATASCVATNNTHVITVGEQLDGKVTNTATATGDAPGTIPDPSDPDTLDTPTSPKPVASLVLTKTSTTADTNGNTVTGDSGDTITYSFSVQNTGTVTLAPVTVTDPLLPTLSCVIASLAAGATSSCTATNNTHVITAGEQTDGKVTNTASATGDAPGTIPDPTDTDKLDTPTLPKPVASLVLTKTGSTADTNGNTVTGDPGDTITYSFSVHNTGTVTLAPVTVTDPKLPTLSCVLASLAAGATASCTATNNTFVILSGDVPAGVTNIATATGDAPGTIPDPTDDDTLVTPTKPAPVASIVLTKAGSTANTNASAVTGDAGDTITYSFSVQNTGTVTLTNVTVTDPMLPTLTCVIAVLAAGATASCTPTNNTHVITQPEFDSKGGGDSDIDNTASVTGTAPGTIPPAIDDDSAAVPLAPHSPSLKLEKLAAPQVYNTLAQTITYTYTVTNTGNVTLSAPFTIADDKIGSFACVGTPAVAQLAPAGTFTCTNTYAIKAADLLTPFKVTNVATVTASDPGSQPITSAPVDETVEAVRADLVLTKTSTPNPFVPGQPLTYSINVLNIGPFPATNVVVTDTFPAGFTGLGALPSPACVLAAGGGSVTCTFASLAVGASVGITIAGATSPSSTLLVNTATVTTDTIDTNPVNNTDDDRNTGQPSADLRVTKTDSVDPVIAGAPLTYTITVTNNGPSDAKSVTVVDPPPVGFQVTGVTDENNVARPECVLSVLCTYATLAAGDSRIIKVVGKVNSNVTDVGIANPPELSNTVTVASVTPDPNNANNTDTETTDVIESADLVLTKIAQGSAVTPGGQRTYNIQVLNAGPSDADGVVVTDALPAQLTFASATGATCVGNGGAPEVVTCSLGTLTVNQLVVITIKVNVDPSVTGAVTNSASVTSTTPDPIPTNNVGTSQDPSDPQADVFLSKDATSISAIAGTQLTYQITGGNAGPSNATNVQIVDNLPIGTSYVSAVVQAGTGTCPTPTTNTVSCSFGTLKPGDVFTIDVTVLIAADYAGTSVTNSATVSSPTPDPKPTNNTDTDVTPVTASADVSVTKLADVTQVRPGDPISYTITVLNSGPSIAKNVKISDDLPAGLTATGATGATCTLGDPLNCSLGTLTVGQSVVIKITASVNPALLGTLDNTVTVTSTTPDPDLGNNVASTSTPTIPEADLSVVKTGPATVVAGTQATYTVVVTNNGPSDAVNASVTDVLPPEATLVSAVPSGSGACVALTCTWSKIAAGTSVSITIVAKIAASATDQSTIINRATATSPTPDPNPNNNTDDHPVIVDTSADMSITKRLTTGPLVPGTSERYELVVTNSGPSDAQSVVVSDTLPSGLTATAATTTAGTCGHDGVTVTCNLGTVAVGGVVTISVLVNVASGVTGNVTNTATVTSPTKDPTPVNNTNTAVDPSVPSVPSADVGIVKTVSPSPFVPGQPVTYTLTVSNAGPSDAVDVTVSDLIPSGMTGTAVTTSAGLCNIVNQKVSCVLGTVVAGATVAVTLTVDTDPSVSTAITNVALVKTKTTDPNPDNNDSEVSVTPAPKADVSIVKSGPATANAVDTIVYKLTVKNAGPSTATAVVVSDPLPAGSTFVGSTGGCTHAAGLVTCSIASIVPGAMVEIDVNVKLGSVPSATDVVNKATVKSATPDPDPANNESSVTTKVEPQPGTITGQIWSDLNRNGVLDPGESDISGVIVRLVCPGSDGIAGTIDDVVLSTVTASPYTFTGVPIGQACVVTVDEASFAAKFPNGTYDFDGNNDGKATVTVTTPGGRVDLVNFGYAAAGQSELPSTGTDSDGPIRAAILLVFLGGTMLAASHRRRRRGASI